MTCTARVLTALIGLTFDTMVFVLTFMRIKTQLWALRIIDRESVTMILLRDGEAFFRTSFRYHVTVYS